MTRNAMQMKEVGVSLLQVSVGVIKGPLGFRWFFGRAHKLKPCPLFGSQSIGSMGEILEEGFRDYRLDPENYLFLENSCMVVRGFSAWMRKSFRVQDNLDQRLSPGGRHSPKILLRG